MAFRGGFPELVRLALPEIIRRLILKATIYDAATEEYPGMGLDPP